MVENRTGANGNIGVEAAAKSAPDGYTILVAHRFRGSTPHVYKMSIDPLKDLVPVIQLSRQPDRAGGASRARRRARSPSSLLLPSSSPGLRYATGSGIGSPQHIVVQWFAQIAGIKLEQVPYRGGAQAINDLVAGH